MTVVLAQLVTSPTGAVHSFKDDPESGVFCACFRLIGDVLSSSERKRNDAREAEAKHAELIRGGQDHD